MQRIICRISEDTSIDELAAKFNTTAANIKRINNTDGILKKGMRVLIDCAQGEYYVVQPFDDIAKIAKKFGVKEQSIVDANSSAIVFIGQRIFIPKE